MKILKSNVQQEDKGYAFDILSKLRAGNRVFGMPAQGLKKTLLKLEENKPEEDSFDTVDYNLTDSDYETEVAKLKKGIKGEEQLGEYFEKIIRLDPKLSDLIVFASLGDEDSGKEYIPDTDFLCIYGGRLLTVDAKAINTKPDIPIFVSGRGIYSAVNHDTPILEVNQQTGVWKKILNRGYETPIDISGCVCIINRTGCEVFRDEEWASSDIKPLHISELVDFLHEWVEGGDPVFDLQLLVDIAKQQVKEEKSSIDLSYAKRAFGV